MTIYFSFLFHIYQPPVQLPYIVRQIANECYLPLIRTFQDNDVGKFSLNCNAVLSEQLYDYGLNSVLDGFRNLAERGQMEFTGSAKFHALLPLLPVPEIERQIKLNLETNRIFFGKSFNPRGFFPPEMAVDPLILDPIKKTGHEWFIMSGVGNPNSIFPTTTFFRTSNGLKVVFRDDSISNDISFDHIDANGFIDRIKYNEHINRDYYVVLAQDGETYGHHIKHAFSKFLQPLLHIVKHRDDIRMVTISELIDRFTTDVVIEPKVSSWSTSGEDLQWENPLPLWYDPDNPIHQLQHKIIMKATALVVTAEQYLSEVPDQQKQMWNVARSQLDRGTHSCQQWWASHRPWYSPDMIIRGLQEIVLSSVNARRSIPKNNTQLQKTFRNALHEIMELETTLIEQLE